MKPYLLLAPNPDNDAGSVSILNSDHSFRLFQWLFITCIDLKTSSFAVFDHDERKAWSVWSTSFSERQPKQFSVIDRVHLDRFIGISLQLASMPVNPCCYPPKSGPIEGGFEVRCMQGVYDYHFKIEHYPLNERRLSYSITDFSPSPSGL